MVKMTRIIIALAVITGGCMLTPHGVQFTADLDGVPFKAITGSWEENVSAGTIFAADINLNTFMILIPGVIEEKEYSFEPAGQDLFSTSAMYLDISEGKTYMSQSGTLTITAKSDRLAGEFELIMVGMDAEGEKISLEVTNGAFDLPNVPLPEM
jgi:hypothetical protein